MPDTAQTAADGFPKSDWTPPDTGVQLAPGGLAAAQAAGYAPKADAPFNPAPPAVPKHVPVVVDLSGRPMTKTYDLVWPKAVDGVEIRQVVAHRISTAEVAAFIDRVRTAPDGDDLPYPIFRRVDGVPLTLAEWNALDDDDTYAMVRDADGFLPARWKAMTASLPATSAPAASGTSGSSSDGSPASA